MSAFMLVEITIKDDDLYSKYMEQIPSVIARYGGRYVIRSSNIIPLSGGWASDRIILVEFGSLTELRRCFGSPEYAQLAPMREKSTTTRSIVIES